MQISTDQYLQALGGTAVYVVTALVAQFHLEEVKPGSEGGICP